MIKNGKRIISRDTKGYKVLLNRVSKEFSECKVTAKKELTYNVVIQMSKQAAINNSGLNYRYRGQCYYEQKTIYIYWNNNDDKNDVLETLAHEFGHVRHRFTKTTDYMKSSNYKREKFADDYSRKILKREIQPSMSHKIRSIAAMNRSR